jgi:integrase
MSLMQDACQKAGLRVPPARRSGVERLMVEEELRFLDQAYARDGRTGLMLQTLLETGLRASELVQLRIEDVSLAERVVITNPPARRPDRARGGRSNSPGAPHSGASLTRPRILRERRGRRHPQL